MKGFPSSTKRELSILLSFLFLFNSVFLTLKCRTLGLIPPHGDRTAAHFVDNGYPSLKGWSVECELHVSTPYEFLV